MWVSSFYHASHMRDREGKRERGSEKKMIYRGEISMFSLCKKSCNISRHTVHAFTYIVVQLLNLFQRKIKFQ